MQNIDQIVDATMAHAIQADAIRAHTLMGWVVLREAAYPGQFVARMVTSTPTPYMLVSDTLPELVAKLPAGLSRTDRQPADPREVVEIWFPADLA